MLSNASSIATNVVMFVIFIGLVTAGVMKGLKDFREFKKPDGSATGTTAQIAAATILENTTLRDWSASNREATVAIVRLCEMVSNLRDEAHELQREIVDLRRAIGDLIRSMPRGER